MPESSKLTSSEIGALWLTYQQKTMISRMMEYFIEKADDEQAKAIMTSLYDQIGAYTLKIADILRSEGAVVPMGFTAQDVNIEVPKLYDNGFDIMLTRLFKEISMGMHSLNITMAYREDIILLFKEMTVVTQETYNKCTQYLIEKGMIARPPYTSMPTSVEFVKDISYISGLKMNPFTERRTLNTVEVAHLHHGIESNVTGMELMLGFAQCAGKPEVKKYLYKGAELAKGIIKDLSEILQDSHIQVPVPSGGNATRSTAAPFSDKLMMYCTSLFCSFSIGGNSLGTAFSLRNDLPAKMGLIMKDVVEYAHEGGKIMIRNGWMEEPPQMEERKQLVRS